MMMATNQSNVIEISFMVQKCDGTGAGVCKLELIDGVTDQTVYLYILKCSSTNCPNVSLTKKLYFKQENLLKHIACTVCCYS